MAELGDFFTTSNEKPSVEVTVDMMDYGYIRECKDAPLLKEILSHLRSGKDGYYPDLMKFTEDRLMDVLPPKEKLKILRLRKEATPSEILEAETELQKWQSEVATKDAQLRSAAPSGKPLPPVRGRSQTNITPKHVTQQMEHQKESSEKPKRLSGYDFRAWEKFDVEAEIAKLDDPPESTSKIVPDRISKEQQQQRDKHLLQLEEFRKRLNYDSLTPLQRQSQADRERQKGNEAFKTSSYEEAFHYYTLSLALAANALTYANRALVHLRQNNFAAAEADCTASLELDSSYVKAWSRRGLCRFKSGKYAQSIQDFEHAMTLSPDNKELVSLLGKARDKYYEVEGKEYSSSSIQNMEEFPVDILSVSRANQLFSLGDVVEITSLPLLTPPKHSPGFTRIVIENSDDEDEDVSAKATDAASTFTRISIADDESETDEPTESFTRVQITQDSEDEAPAATFTSVAIEVEDTDEEDDAAEKHQLAVPSTELKAQADKHMQMQEYEEAIQLYTEIIDRNEQSDVSVAALSNRTLAWLQRKNYNNVISDATLLLSGKPSSLHASKAYFRRALAYESIQQYSSALKDVENVLALDKANSVASKMLERLRLQIEENLNESNEYREEQLSKKALQAYSNGRYSEAISYIEQALSSSSSLPLRHLLSSCYSSLGNNEKALQAALDILNLDSMNFKALVRVAELYIEKGDKTSARDYVARAQAIEPSSQQLAPLVDALEPPVAATPATSPSASSTPSSSQTPAELSEHFKSLGNKAIASQDYATAIKHYSTAISHDSANIACYNNRSLAFLKSNQFEHAEMDASVVLKHGDNAKAFYRRAIARKNLRKYAAAMEDICTLLLFEPHNKEAAKEKAEIEDLLMQPSRVESTRDANASSPPPAEVIPGLSVRSSTMRKRDVPATPQTTLTQTPSPKKVVKPKTTPTSAPKLRPPSVPTEPPATLYELERIWRGLKNYPDLFAVYLKTFKKSTFKRVLKDAVSQDLLADIFAAVRNILVVQDADAAKRVMTGITAAPKFQMMVSLLPDDVLSNIRQVLDIIEDGASLRATYGV